MIRTADWTTTSAADREPCGAVLERGLAGELRHFGIDLDRLPTVAELVAAVKRDRFPGPEISQLGHWGHFRVDDLDLVALLDGRTAQCSREEKARVRFDLVTTRVLLDVVVDERWQYRDPWMWQTVSRSEGLAVATFAMFLDGLFSSDRAEPLRADAWSLQSMDTAALERGFQCSRSNALEGLEDRAELLRRVGVAVASKPELFGERNPRIGRLYDYIVSKAKDDKVRAIDLLEAVLEGFAPVWSGWLESVGEGLGACDKLSHRLASSLIEPIEAAGYPVIGKDELRALAEYRNGELLGDPGLIFPKDPDLVENGPAPGSEVAVEWTALTLALMERVAEKVREVLVVEAGGPVA